jgi:rhamnose utilization protein RhaD (predicted bifunctional aldolase and dehydrogenase)
VTHSRSSSTAGHTAHSQPPPPATPAALVALSARLGADRLLVQGGGGNTSYKSNNDFWVKASGTWLAQAETQDIFVHLPLGDVRGAMASDAPESALLALVAAGGPRASIETSLHALMPQAVVLHVHSVNTIAVAARADAQSLLNERLQGLAWAWVPYRRPGLPLTDAIRETLAKAATAPDILILGNHGLVVAGNDCMSAEALLHQVEARLALPARTLSPPDLNRLHAVNDAGWRIADRDLIHALATDTVARAVALHGALYPDHVVFLGERAAIGSLAAGRAAGRFCAWLASAGLRHRRTRRRAGLAESQLRRRCHARLLGRSRVKASARRPAALSGHRRRGRADGLGSRSLSSRTR